MARARKREERERKREEREKKKKKMVKKKKGKERDIEEEEGERKRERSCHFTVRAEPHTKPQPIKDTRQYLSFNRQRAIIPSFVSIGHMSLNYV